MSDLFEYIVSILLLILIILAVGIAIQLIRMRNR